ncbi:MAG: hypothetical protein ABJB05_00530 [Parafilimonas sp.]
MNDQLHFILTDYSDNKLLQLLIKSLPHGSIADNILLSFHTKEKERRLKEFFDEISKGNTTLNEQDILNDDFLHKYYITLNAVVQSKRTEKIQYFAHLLLNSKSDLINEDYDSYEDFIKVLDDLSFQEFYILKTIVEIETINEISFPRKSIGHYKTLIQKISSDLSISENEAESLIVRLNRTGLIILNKGNVYKQEVHNYVITTELFHKLKKLVLL